MTRFKIEEEMILLSAGTEARREAMREQAERLGAMLDWSHLAALLRGRRLLPMLGPRIVELAGNSASDEFVAVVAGAVESGRRQGAFLQLIATRVMSALAGAGVRSTPLKGPLLGEAIYGDPGRRLSGDIDLLVPPEQLRTAVEVVLGLGYGPPADYVERGGLPLLHFALVHERGELPPVELHWRIHWYERSFACERLLPPAGSFVGDWRPAPTDELAALLLFYARDGFVDLRLATDLSAWWDAFGAKVPRGGLDQLLRVYPALTRVVPVAARVAEQVVGLPATQIVADLPKSGLRGRIAMRLANPNPHTSESQLYADMGLIDGLLMPPGEFRAFVRRQVLLPREVLDERAQRASRWRIRSPLGRGVGVLIRYLLTMTRLVRTPDVLR